MSAAFHEPLIEWSSPQILHEGDMIEPNGYDAVRVEGPCMVACGLNDHSPFVLVPSAHEYLDLNFSVYGSNMPIRINSSKQRGVQIRWMNFGDVKPAWARNFVKK